MEKRLLTSKRHLLLSLTLTVLMSVMGQSAWGVGLTALTGTGGTGFEGYQCLVDGRTATKWLTDVPATIIFKADEALVPSVYTLITGGDTSRFPGRNWRSWDIYGANFSSDSEATDDAEAWVLIDHQTEITNDQLPAGDLVSATFEFSEDNSTAFQYFMIKVSEASDGTTIQMSEFMFGENLNVTYTALSGVKGFNDAESFPSLVDGNGNTKWCTNDTHEGYENGWWIVFKASDKLVPAYYSLMTGNDTQGNPGRNWKTWRIYGANFESDDEATRNSEGWVLIDNKVNVGQDRLGAANYSEFYFGLSEKSTTPYQYYKVEINEAYSGGLIQMGELTFGQAAQYPQVRSTILHEVNTFDPNTVAEQVLIDKYQAKLDAMAQINDIEELIAARLELIAIQGEIAASASSYTSYQSMVNFAKSELEAGKIASAGRATINDYVNNTIEPNGNFPNGSYPYIWERHTLSAADIEAETNFLFELIDLYSTGSDAGIDVVYESLDGTAGFNQDEGFQSLVDGNDDTKWCSNTGHENYDNGWWIVFKASDPIKPSYYRLFTGNDTGNSPDRNWKTWYIYGGNFASDEEATKDAEGWVLIDEKVNIGADQLPAANKTAAFFYTSTTVTTEYQYFKVVITASGGGLQQMGELSFGNQSNFLGMRSEFYALASEFDYDVIAMKSLTDRYAEALAQLRKTTSITTMNTLYAELTSLQPTITASQESYAAYQDSINYVSDYLSTYTDFAGPSREFLEKYLDEYIEPGETYNNGSYKYIIENRKLNDKAIRDEAIYVMNLLESAILGGSVALRGSTGFTSNEGFAALIDGLETSKWCMPGVTPSTPGYAIFKTAKPTAPFFYTLITGNDTGTFPSRNWKTWSIYGANFESDDEAVLENEGWVLIDHKEDIGQDRLGAANFTPFYFGLSEENTDEYQYFKVVVESANSGDAIQMSELQFGNESDFLDILSDIYENLSAKDLDIAAEQALLTEFESTLEEIYQATDMESLVAQMNKANDLSAKIDASVAAYQKYDAECTYLAQYLDEHDDFDSAERTTLEEYLDTYVEPSETYTNGTYSYIIENHLLSGDELDAEIESLETLLRTAIANGYKAGSDVTLLLINPDFKKEKEGWEGTVYDFGNNGVNYAGQFWDNKFDLYQTIEGLKPGIYEMQMYAGQRPADDQTSINYSAVIYANENVNYVMADPEGMISVEDAIDHENCYITGETADREIYNEMGELIGYGLHGLQSCCYAFGAGRHADNKVAVNVGEDGKLTIGIANWGTNGGSDWVGFGLTSLRYLGSVDEADLSGTLESMVARANTAKENIYDQAEYKKCPNYSEELRTRLQAAITAAESASTGAEQYALVEEFSKLFTEIYQCKQAYINLLADAEALYDAAYGESSIYTFTDIELESIADAYENIDVKCLEGAYTLQEALDQTELKNCLGYISVYGIEPESIDGVYQIATYNNLRWLSATVNKGNTGINAVMVDDIDLAEVANWISIGNNSNPFTGNFNGQNHKITNFNQSTPANYGGLFGMVKEGSVSNFSIEGTLICNHPINGVIGACDNSQITNVHSALNIDATASGLTHTGGITGEASNSTVIRNCSFSGTLTVGPGNNDCFAGIAAYTNTGSFYNCANYGTITFDNAGCFAAGIFGYVNNASCGGIHNCLGVGKIEYTGGTSTYAGALIGWLRNYSSAAFETSFWLADCAERASGSNTLSTNFSASASELASGAICYALNEGQETPQWFQTLGVDPYPVLDPTHGFVKRAEDGTFYNDGTAIESIKTDIPQDKVYTINGIRVEKTQKGVYIINGKKVMVK